MVDFVLVEEIGLVIFNVPKDKIKIHVYQDLPDLDDMDEDLRAYCAFALNADDPNFWSNLK